MGYVGQVRRLVKWEGSSNGKEVQVAIRAGEKNLAGQMCQQVQMIQMTQGIQVDYVCQMGQKFQVRKVGRKVRRGVRVRLAQ